MKPNESFVEQPIRSLQTMLRVIAENDRRFPTVVPDGIYGPTTANAVSVFQRIYGLPVTGIVNEQTWTTIVAAYEPALIEIAQAQALQIRLDPGGQIGKGDSGPYVYLIQAMLTQLSNDYSSITPPGNDGNVDANTAASISDFQRLAGLPDTGVLTKETWKHLVNHFSANAHYNRLSKNITNTMD